MRCVPCASGSRARCVTRRQSSDRRIVRPLLSYLPTTNCAKPWLRIEPDTSPADTGLTDTRRAAVFLEPIQGEGGIVVPEIMMVAELLGGWLAAISTTFYPEKRREFLIPPAFIHLSTNYRYEVSWRSTTATSLRRCA